jgi:hypothetical protein
MSKLCLTFILHCYDIEVFRSRITKTSDVRPACMRSAAILRSLSAGLATSDGRALAKRERPSKSEPRVRRAHTVWANERPLVAAAKQWLSYHHGQCTILGRGKHPLPSPHSLLHNIRYSLSLSVECLNPYVSKAPTPIPPPTWTLSTTSVLFGTIRLFCDHI